MGDEESAGKEIGCGRRDQDYGVHMGKERKSEAELDGLCALSIILACY